MDSLEEIVSIVHLTQDLLSAVSSWKKIIPDQVRPTSNFIYANQNNHHSAGDLTNLELKKRKEYVIDRSFYITTKIP